MKGNVVSPVNLSYGGVLTEGRVMLVGLFPDLLAALCIIGGVDGIVNADDDDQSPGEGYKDPIQAQGVGIMRLATSEGIVDCHGVERGDRRRSFGEVETCSLHVTRAEHPKKKDSARSGVGIGFIYGAK